MKWTLNTEHLETMSLTKALENSTGSWKEKPQHLVNSTRSSMSILMKLPNKKLWLRTWLTRTPTKSHLIGNLIPSKKFQLMTRRLRSDSSGLWRQNSLTLSCGRTMNNTVFWMRQNRLPNMRVSWMTKAFMPLLSWPTLLPQVKMG